jgi:hypothetical protein
MSGGAPALQAFLRASAAAGRTVVSVPPFTAYLTEDDPLRFLNYAIPDGDVEPSRAEIDGLRRELRSRDRLPRLEWVEEAAPRVAPALAAGGMVEELRTPLMACTADELVDAAADVEGLSVAAVREADVRETSDLQRVAFGMEPLPAGAPPSSFARPRGGGAVLARAGDGTPVAVAVVVTAAAARAAFVAGARLCVLSPGDDTAQRVYARAGFRRAATMLHWSDPN